MANPHPLSKPQLRHEVRARLDQFTPDELRSASHLIVSHLTDWLSTHHPVGVLATFAALPREPFLVELQQSLPQWRFAYPRVSGPGHMAFHIVTDPASQLSIARFGIAEPDPDCCCEVPAEEISVILCPGEAFTPNGHRLGKGGGFYDRYLARCPQQIPRVGIAYAAQIVASIPVDPHDHHVEWLATERGIAQTHP